MTCTSRCSTYKITRGLNRRHCQTYQGNGWWELRVRSASLGMASMWDSEQQCCALLRAVLSEGAAVSPDVKMWGDRHWPNRGNWAVMCRTFLLWNQLNKGTSGQWGARGGFHEVLRKHLSPLRRLCFHPSVYSLHQTWWRDEEASPCWFVSRLVSGTISSSPLLSHHWVSF